MPPRPPVQKKPSLLPKESPKQNTNSHGSSKDGILNSLPQLKSSDFGLRNFRTSSEKDAFGVTDLRESTLEFMSGSSGLCADGQSEKEGDEPNFGHHKDEPVWNLKIPTLPAPNPLTLGQYRNYYNFDLETAVATFQHGTTEQGLRNYIGYQNNQIIKSKINREIEGIQPCSMSSHSIKNGPFESGLTMVEMSMLSMQSLVFLFSYM